MTDTPTQPKPRGLAALKLKNPDRFWEIQRKATANSGANFARNKELASRAGAIGGRISRPKQKAKVGNDVQANND